MRRLDFGIYVYHIETSLEKKSCAPAVRHASIFYVLSLSIFIGHLDFKEPELRHIRGRLDQQALKKSDELRRERADVDKATAIVEMVCR